MNIKKRTSNFLKYIRTKNLMVERRKHALPILTGYKSLKPLTSQQKKEIKDYWHDISGSDKLWFDMRYYEMFNDLCDDPSQLKYYIPDDFYYCYIDLFLADDHYGRKFDDKTLYELYFPEVKHPMTIVRRSGECLLGHDYQIIDIEQAVKLCHEAGSIIFKPSLVECGGKSIRFWEVKDGDDRLRQSLNNRHYVIQTLIKQHEQLAKIHQDSVNTIRVLTLLFEGRVHVISTILRMGANGSKVDNGSSGGICCGILPDGHLRPYARTLNGQIFDQHPQGLKFDGFAIPEYEKICQLACQMAPRMQEISRLISWDFTVDSSGDPVLIEANLYYGGCNVHQFCNGPIFGNMTDSVLRYVFKHNPMLAKR